MALSFSHAVLAWARTKPADEPYQYADFRNCAICQFLKDTGRCDDPAVSFNHWRDRAEWPAKFHDFDDRVRAAALASPNTFGALADRLEAAL